MVFPQNEVTKIFKKPQRSHSLTSNRTKQHTAIANLNKNLEPTFNESMKRRSLNPTDLEKLKSSVRENFERVNERLNSHGVKSKQKWKRANFLAQNGE